MPFSTTIWPPPAQSKCPTSRIPEAEAISIPHCRRLHATLAELECRSTMEETMSTEARRDFFRRLAIFGGIAAMAAPLQAKAQTPSKRFIKREAAERSGYSAAVVTQGGRTIWLAGMTGAVDATGK